MVKIKNMLYDPERDVLLLDGCELCLKQQNTEELGEEWQIEGGEDCISGLAICGMNYEFYEFRADGGGSNDEESNEDNKHALIKFIGKMSKYQKYFDRMKQRIIPAMDSYFFCSHILAASSQKLLLFQIYHFQIL